MAPRAAATTDQSPAEPAVDVPPARASRVENLTQIVIMLTVGGAAGAASFTHVHNVAAAHGQAGWLAWADAVVLELMSVAAGLELRHRKRRRHPTGFPATVLVCAVMLSIAAQVVEAEQSVIGWLAAALPALGFLVMTKIALNRAAPSGPPRGTVPVPVADAVPAPVPVPAENAAGRGMRKDRSRRDGNDRPPTARPGKTPTNPPSPPRSPAGQALSMDGLLTAAAAARDTLARQGIPLTRDSLAQELRRNGYAVRTTRISAVLARLRQDEPTPPEPSQAHNSGTATGPAPMSLPRPADTLRR